MQSKFVVIGTAGHIDHGKSSLVKALTGIDPDRLEEEKKRGMTIDIGFSKLELPSGILAGIVDVPGHEKFIRNMLAGASGIDMVLLVVAGDEGVKPQTIEHFDVCRFLGVKKGVIVITKKDLIDEEILELVKEEIRELVKGSFLEDAPIVAVSSKTGEGLKELVESIDSIARKVKEKSTDHPLRLPVDRVFTIKGHGTVITGTLVSGTVKEGDTVEVFPGGLKAKVRQVQVHGQKVLSALAGQRTALNLSGIEKEKIKRGSFILEPGWFLPSKVFEGLLEVSRFSQKITSGKEFVFHHFTFETACKVVVLESGELKPGEKGFVRIELEKEVPLVYSDRFVLRGASGVVAGGIVLNVLDVPRLKGKRKRERVEFLKKLQDSENLLETVIAQRLDFNLPKLFVMTGLSKKNLEEKLNELEKKGLVVKTSNKLLNLKSLDRFKTIAKEELERYHKEFPISRGMNKETLREKLSVGKDAFEMLIEDLKKSNVLVEEEGVIRLAEFTPEHKGTKYEEKVDKLIEILKNSSKPLEIEEISRKLNLTEKETNMLVSYLKMKKLCFRAENFVISKLLFEKMVSFLKEHFKKKKTLSVSEFKEHFSLSRKYAIPVLELFDSLGYTQRSGKERIAGKNLE